MQDLKIKQSLVEKVSLQRIFSYLGVFAKGSRAFFFNLVIPSILVFLKQKALWMGKIKRISRHSGQAATIPHASVNPRPNHFYTSRKTARIPILFFLFLSFLLSSCGGLKSEFTRNNTLLPGFYAKALDKACKTEDSTTITSIEVYKTAFQERFVEDGHVIVQASINDSSTRELVDYKAPRTGYYQDMYLVKVSTKCEEPRWFYYSVWYRYDLKKRKQVAYGFGKAYRGIANEMAGTIYFNTPLIVKETRQGFALQPKGQEQLYFVIDDMSASTLRVNRLVVEAKNKFGGPRSYVFKVEEAFPDDMKRIEFAKIASQKFN